MRRRGLLLAAAMLAACSKRNAPRQQALPSGAVVLALGDSITYGTGAAPQDAYPAQLAGLTGWKLINGGVPGDTSAQALARLPALLAEHQPVLVILSAGGNDFLHRMPDVDTEQNLRRTVAAARAAGAEVVLVGVPRPTVAAALGAGLSDHPMYQKLAAELSLPLHAGGWARVLADDRLKSDQLHANAAGYREFAMGLAATLRGAGLLQ